MSTPIERDRRIVEICKGMRKGRRYRPHELNEFGVGSGVIQKDFDLLDDLGIIERQVDRGLVWYTKR
jgi:hypothetical protein